MRFLQSKIDRNMAAETVNTYTFNPEPRSTFSPQNIQGETKGQQAQEAHSTAHPMKLERINVKSK